MKTPEQYRLRRGPLQSLPEDGNNGCFLIPFESYKLMVIASDGQGWEHVSVSLKHRIPNWKEMSYVKSLFWDEETCVIQFHPPKSQYINNHAHVLHLWKPVGKEIETPPSILVGLKELNQYDDTTAGWKQYQNSQAWPGCTQFWQKCLLEVGDQRIVYANIVEFEWEMSGSKHIGYEVHIQIPEGVSFTGTTINTASFSYKTLDFALMEQHAQKIIDTLTRP